MYYLICEGKCNPNIGIADSLALQYGEKLNRRESFGLQGMMVRLQRQLRYTDHEELDSRAYICQNCGHGRRFGL